MTAPLRRFVAALAGVASLSLTGCGLSLPKMQPFALDDAKTEGLKESSLIGFVKCELHLAVQQVLDLADRDQANTRRDPTNYPPHPSIDWLRDWGATVSLKIIVDEKSTLAPGLSFISPMESVVSTFASGPAVTSTQSFSFGIGASVASEATRTENISFYYPFSDLLADGAVSKEGCRKVTPATIEADLGIDDFLRSKYEAATTPKLILHKLGVPADGSVSPFDTFTYDVQFIVTTMGSATPTWKLVHISANPTGTLLNLSRARTDDVLITMGKAVKDQTGKTVAQSPEATLQLQANLIGQAVASALRNQQP